MRNSFLFRIRNRRWRNGFPTFFQRNLFSVPGGSFSSGMSKLNSDFACRVFMNEFHYFGKRICLIIIPDSHAFICYSTFRHHARCFDNDEADSALGAASIMHKMEIVGHSIFAGIHTHWRHYPTVFQF